MSTPPVPTTTPPTSRCHVVCLSVGAGPPSVAVSLPILGDLTVAPSLPALLGITSD